MISLKERVWFVLKHCYFVLTAWVVPNNHASIDTGCGISLPDKFLIRIEAQIIDDKENFHTSLGSIPQFLQSDACNIFMIHRVSLNADDILRVVYLLPEHVKEPIVVLIDLHGPFELIGVQ
jgi:hypothetical protein